MAIRTASSIDISNITGEQIGACHKVFEGSTSFYKVANSDGKIDDNGDIIEYSVRWSKEHGFTCTCKAGQNGVLCWHVKASIACEREVREAVAEMHRLIAEQTLTAQVQAAMSDPATIKAAEIAKETPVQVKRDRATTPYQPRAFSILR